MNSTSLVPYLVQQAVFQLPLLSVYVIGIVICAVRARRAPGGAVLAIVGLGLMLLSSLEVLVGQAMVVQGSGASMASRGQMMMVVSILGMILRTVGVVLLIAAVFAGRADTVRSGFEVPMAGAGS
jgi:hypothetical protein